MESKTIESRSVEYLELNEVRIAALLAEKERSNVGAQRLLKSAKDHPQGLGVSTISAWLNGGAKTARADHYEYVLREWRACPSSTPLTPELCTMLCAERDRTGVGAVALLKARSDVPKGLTPLKLSHWLSGRDRAAPSEHVEYVLKLWRALPDNEWIELTPELIQRLNSTRKASGVSPAVLARRSRLQLIDITVLDITRALTGEAKTIRRRHLELMLGGD